MHWSRETHVPVGPWLRTLVVLGLVFALVAETPVRAVGGLPAWLTLGGTGNVPVPAGAPGAPELAAAKGKHDAKSKGKRDTKDKTGKTGKHDHQDKGTGTGKNDKDQGSKQVTQERTRKAKRGAHRRGGAGALTAAPLTIAPAADAQVNEANPNHNYGAKARLLVDGGEGDPEVASYLRFDVSGVTAPVQQATLRLWVQGSGGTQNGPEVRSTDTSWSETSLTWTTRPEANGGVLDDKGRLAGGTWAEYDVTRAVRGNGAFGFVLLSQSKDGAVFDSRERDHGPELVIAIEGDTPPPPPDPSPTATTEPDPTATPEPTASPSPSPTATPPPTGESATLLAAGDIASCSSSGDEATAKLLDNLTGSVATLGDNVYDSGTASEFTTCYDPTWGRFKSRTKPAPGNHDYTTSGATGYYGYFGAAAGDPKKGYYSYELGSWHIVALNSNCAPVGGCGAGSPQETWLRADLAAHPTTCTLAYWHHPRFSFGNYGNDAMTQALWQALYDAGAEIVLSGHDHNYQRWSPQTPSGTRDATGGIREFVVGTGGRSHYALGTAPANVEKANDTTFGVLQLTLHPSSYDWTFVPEAGKNFTDAGSTSCH